MFPSFPHLAEAIAAERAADFQREATAYRRARGIRRPLLAKDRAGARPRPGHGRVPAGVARHDSCAPAR
jgi:hypothetical protein